MKLIPRTQYMDFLNRHRDRQIIKVVTGVRRCGKSTLLQEFRDSLLAEGIPKERIISINFEDLRNAPLCNYLTLNDYVMKRLVPGKKNYVFLDEIQHVPQFEKVVDSLFIQDNVDLYITGSNAYFLSGELATLLAGRYVEIEMLPLSFREFRFSRPASETLAHTYDLYTRNGGFPFTLQMEDDTWAIREYLSGIYNTILLKDVVARLRVSDVNVLDHITRYLMSNIGSPQSMRKISNTLTSQNLKVDEKTVDRYVYGLRESLLLYEAPRFNVQGKSILSTNAKYFAVDPGLRNILVSTPLKDMGHILENVVYLELRRRYPKVYVGAVPRSEIDFVCQDWQGLAYYQVALTTLDEQVLTRELAPLRSLKDQYPKYLLTLDEIGREGSYDGIIKLNALDWLMGKTALG